MVAVSAAPTDRRILLARIGTGDENAFGDPLPALRTTRARTRDPAPGRPRPGGGRAPGCVRLGLAFGVTFKPERGQASAWLYAVARNAISDRGRKREEPAAEAPDTPARDPGPDESAENAWLRWRVHRALEELPERERELIELAYWSELSQSEIAERLELPLGTVKTRTRSALARLADALDEELR